MWIKFRDPLFNEYFKHHLDFEKVVSKNDICLLFILELWGGIDKLY